MKKFFLFAAILITFCVYYLIFSVNYRAPWHPHGEHGVANEIVFGAIHNPKKRARHYALTTAKIFNGTKPSSQIKNLPIDNHLVINCAATRKISFKIPKSLLGIVKKSYSNINTEGNK